MPESAAAGLSISVREIPLERQADILASLEIRKGHEAVLLRIRNEEYVAPNLDASVSFELNRSRVQRLFTSSNSATKEVLATCLLYPAQIHGILHPKLTLASHITPFRLPVDIGMDQVGWIDLKVLDLQNRGRGIGNGFIRKLMTSQRLDFYRDFRHGIALVEEGNEAAIALALKHKGRILVRNRNQIFFFFSS
jgi:hypothetical protein